LTYFFHQLKALRDAAEEVQPMLKELAALDLLRCHPGGPWEQRPEAVARALAQQSEQSLERLHTAASVRELVMQCASAAVTEGSGGGKMEEPPPKRHCGGRGPDLDCSPLFFEPGTFGFLSLRPAKYFPSEAVLRRGHHLGSEDAELPAEAYRLAWYESLGRVMAICLVHGDLFPLRLCRHVLKFLLGRTVSFHDLAFYDPSLYESFRKLVVEYANDPELMASLHSVFQVTLVGGQMVELVPGGAEMAVTPANVTVYVERYAQMLMVDSVRPGLEALRAGLHAVLPPAVLDGLTAEDLRLLLNGCETVDLGMLQRCTVFQDEVRDSVQFERMKRWFWSTVAGMDAQEQHDLLYFWTSSPVMPANEAALHPKPVVLIRPPSDVELPTANTCSSRLCLPASSRKSILVRKLKQAITTKGFGFM
jgi:E3 ubiquitin-protein ligase EDD1